MDVTEGERSVEASFSLSSRKVAEMEVRDAESIKKRVKSGKELSSTTSSKLRHVLVSFFI